MNKLFFNYFLIIILNYFNITFGDEILFQINVNRPVNIISNKYVSFSIDPKIVSESVGGNNSQIIDHMASQLSPAYFKISGETFFKLTSVLSNNIEIEDEIRDSNPEDLLRNFNDWISSVGWKPIIPLPYSPIHWDSMEALRILNISRALGIKNCIWQLGIDFNATEATNYVADLITLQTMVGAFHDYVDDWRIVGADISAGSNAEETKLYVDLVKHIVEAVGWTPSTEYKTPDNLYTVSDKDMAVKNILNSRLPSWLSLPSKSDKYTNTDGCSVFCVTEGLQWGQVLGDAARIGFKVIYKPLSVSDFNEPNLGYYISLLFKRNMGEKVFDTKIIGVDNFVTRLYTHCAKEKSGGLSMMAINMADTRSNILAKFPLKSTGSELWQYIITINNGIVMLNDEAIHLNSTLDPFIKIKHPSRPISISLPPMSIGFWVLPHANHDECLITRNNDNLSSEEQQTRKPPKLRTSSEKLLQQLIMKSAAAEATLKKRERRHVVVKKDSKYLKQQLADLITHSNSNLKEAIRYKRFLLKSEKPKGLTNIMKNASKRIKRQAIEIMGRRRPGFRGRFPLGRNMQKAINIPTTTTVIPPTNAQNPTSSQVSEDEILQRKSNINLQNVPNGDVHFKLTNVDGDYDYVEFDENKAQKKMKIKDVPDDESFGKVPTAFHESYQIQKVIPRENAYANGEIWEAISKPDIQRLDAETNKHFPDDQHIAYITKELEPTYNQNNAGLRQAQQQLQSYYMQTLDSREQKSSLNHNSPLDNHGMIHQQVATHYKYPNTDDDEYFSNSRESFYGNNNNNNNHYYHHNTHNPIQTIQQPSRPIMPTATTTNTRYPNSNLRWKRSLCEKCLVSKLHFNKINKCKCLKESSSAISENSISSSSHSRKRRNAVLKSISWALSNEVNVIPKEMNNHDEVYQRMLPYRLIPKNYHISMRPHNYDDVQKLRSTISNPDDDAVNNNGNLYLENLESLNERTSNTDKRHIDNTKSEQQNSIIVNYGNGNNNGDEERQPKFMQMFSEKVSNFMDMINHHVSGWWNTWA